MSNTGTYYIETYGCSVNQQDGEIIEGILEKLGFRSVKEPNKADILIVNTCIVKKATEDKMRERIRALSKLNKKLIIAGCMAEALPEKIKALNPGAWILSPHHLDELPQLIKSIYEGKKVELKGIKYLDKSKLPRKIRNKLYAPVTISQGCLGNCTFCITKIARGFLKSYPLESVVSEINRLINRGIKEIRLTGQDTGSYGRDIGLTLIDLLYKIEEIPGSFMVRLGMANPDTIMPILDDLIEFFKKSKKFYKYLHLPVQSGSNKILKIMGRKYTVEEYIELVKTLRKELGDELTIATDIIVAFPGESDEDFNETLSLLRNVKPDIVNISRYGDRPKTFASKLYPKIHSKIAKERSIKVTELVKEISLSKNKRYLGKILNVLVLEKENKTNRFIGRTINYRLVVIENSHENSDILGKWVPVKINDVTWKTLYGEMIQ